jgi:uncharacterized protein (DUF849 family)
MLSEIGPDGLPWNKHNYKPLIINVALTGAVPSKEDFPQLPIKPSEIASDVSECAALGAQVFHLHMRDDNGLPTQNKLAYIDTIEEIRARNPEVLLCVTTSSRASADFEDRIAPLRLQLTRPPELASLSLGSFNFPKTISRNPPDEIELLAQHMNDSGIKPEIEVFEPGMVSRAIQLRNKGKLADPLVINILLGNNGTSGMSAQSLTPFLSQLDSSAEWALAGIGRFQRKAIMIGVALGGNVRVGMEDDPVGDGSGNWTNAKAVKLAKEAAKFCGRPLASFEEVRTRFGLTGMN